MSGAGKSTLLRELASRGWRAVDADDETWCIWDDGDDPGWLWREDRIRSLLDAPRDTPLVVAGTVPNMGAFEWDHTVLLTAPLDVLLERVADRPDNPYGSTDADRELIARHHAEVEPRLREWCDLVLSGRSPVDELADQLTARLPDRFLDLPELPAQFASPDPKRIPDGYVLEFFVHRRGDEVYEVPRLRRPWTIRLRARVPDRYDLTRGRRDVADEARRADWFDVDVFPVHVEPRWGPDAARVEAHVRYPGWSVNLALTIAFGSRTPPGGLGANLSYDGVAADGVRDLLNSEDAPVGSARFTFYRRD